MDYQGNPNKDKEDVPKIGIPIKQVDKVITGEVVQRPKPLGRKFKETFFGGDFKVAMRYVAADVLLPAFRNLIVDATSKGIERIVYGESSYRNRPVDARSRIQYNNPIHFQRNIPDTIRSARYSDPRSRSYRSNRRDVSDILLASRDEAELVVERLIDIIDKYEVAALADLYDLLGLPHSHVDNKWGWTYLNNIEVRQVRDGYLIDLPALEEI